MTRPMPVYECFDVVVVPFPFTDRAATKRRPALVLSAAQAFNNRAGHALLAMITSARHSVWPLDTEIEDLLAAGLPGRSVVRMKLFTLDLRFVLERVGSLGLIDRSRVSIALRSLLAGAI